MVLRFFTTNDEIVNKTLESIAKVTKKGSIDSPVIVGGIAVQLYSHDKELLRPTSDIDLLYVPKISNFMEFKENIGGKIQRIIKQNYQAQLKKSRNLYEVKIMNGQHNNAKELFFIHFDKLSKHLEEKNNKIQLEEAKNAIEYIINDKRVFVVRIEDILARKILRAKKNLWNVSNSPLESSIMNYCNNNNWKELSKIPLESWVDLIIQNQNEFPADLKKLPVRYSLNKDLYDICLISRYIEGTEGSFNKPYFFETKEKLEKL